MPTAPPNSDDDPDPHRSVDPGLRDQGVGPITRRKATDRSLQAALGMHELTIALVELKDFSITVVSNAALRRIGLTAELVIGRPIAELLREEDREASRMALRALRDGVIDFYQASRHLDPSDTSGLAFTGWARSVEFGDERFAMVEMAFGDQEEPDQEAPEPVAVASVQQRPLAEILGHEPPAMAIGMADATWVVTSISKDIFQLLGVTPEVVIGSQLLDAVDQDDVQSLLEAERLVNDEYSVARAVRMQDVNGQWRSLCCVLATIAKPGERCFILLPYLDVRFDTANRASELEQHLFRIAAELDASGILQRVGDFPSPSQHPELGELTTRQWEVLRRLMRGQRVPTIAAEMFLSRSTIRNHLSAIFERFEVHSQTELLALLIQI